MRSRNFIVGLLSFLTLIDLYGSQAILPKLTVFFDTDPASMGVAVNASTFGMAAYITGNVLSNLVGRLMAANFADWFGLSVSFWLFALLNLVAALVAYLCLGKKIERMAAVGGLSVMEIWKIHLSNLRLQASFALGFLILFVFLSMFTYVNFVLSAPPFSLEATQLGLVYFVFLPAVFTTPLAGKMVSSRGTYFGFVMSTTMALIGLLALLTSSMTLLILGLAAIGGGTFCAQAFVSGQIGASATADRATASGLYLMSYYLGGLTGAAIIGRVYTLSGWNMAIYILVALCLFAMVVARSLGRPIPSTEQ